MPVPAQRSEAADAEPSPVSEPVSVSEPEPVAEPAAPKARRRRTGLLFGLAVALGVLGGAGTGYGIQAARTPTPLPPLTVAQPAYPSARASAPALSADEDDMVRTDGDLTKLLMPVPKGSKLSDDLQGWLSLSEYAQYYDKPGAAFNHQLELGFRRVARESWTTGDLTVTVELSQFQHTREDSAASDVSDQLYYASDYGRDGVGLAIPGYPSGRAHAGKKRLHYDDGTAYYESRALASHGDIAVTVFVEGPKPIPAKTGLALIESQLERL